MRFGGMRPFAHGKRNRTAIGRGFRDGSFQKRLPAKRFLSLVRAEAFCRAAACDDGREIRHAIGRNPVPGGASGDLTRRLGESQRPAYMRLPIAIYCIAQSNRI